MIKKQEPESSLLEHTLALWRINFCVIVSNVSFSLKDFTCMISGNLQESGKVTSPEDEFSIPHFEQNFWL